jgi:hypothetical protein
MNASSPSFSEIELTIALPCTHLQPGLDDLPLGGVDHHRHAEMSGSAAARFRKRDHGLDGVEHALVHVDVDDLGAVLDLLRATSSAVS